MNESRKKTFLGQFFGTKKFYRQVFALTLPILIQTGITNFVNMLDNVMVGRLGTAEMTGVEISNQFLFIFNLCIFGAVSGAGIFGAQFFGSGDTEGVRHTFRFKLISTTVLTLAAAALFYFAADWLIGLFLKGEAEPENVEETLKHARTYMLIMLIGLLPYSVTQCFSSSLRETGETVLPMTAGIVAVFVNLVLNFLLIFGHLGLPALGVAGAAIATVVSRFVELFVVAGWSLAKRKRKHTFLVSAFSSLRVPLPLVRQIILKGLPLMLNETLWALGLTLIAQYYSERGLEVVTAYGITYTFFGVFFVALQSVGMAIGIMLGQILGAGEIKRAKDSAKILITFSVLISLAIGALFAGCAFFIPYFYNTTDSIRRLSTAMMIVCAVTLPLESFANATYFTLRSGGKSLLTVVFDSGFVWAVLVPLSFCLVRFTNLPILPLYAVCQLSNILKCAVGFVFVKRGSWAKDLVSDGKAV